MSTDEQSPQDATGDSESAAAAQLPVPEPALPDLPKYSLLLYTVARLGLLLVAAAVLYLVGARSWLLVILAFVVSGLLSFVLLRRLRDGVSVKVAAKVDASRERRAAAGDAEDDLY